MAAPERTEVIAAVHRTGKLVEGQLSTLLHREIDLRHPPVIQTGVLPVGRDRQQCRSHQRVRTDQPAAHALVGRYQPVLAAEGCPRRAQLSGLPLRPGLAGLEGIEVDLGGVDLVAGHAAQVRRHQLRQVTVEVGQLGVSQDQAVLGRHHLAPGCAQAMMLFAGIASHRLHPGQHPRAGQRQVQSGQRNGRLRIRRRRLPRHVHQHPADVIQLAAFAGIQNGFAVADQRGGCDGSTHAMPRLQGVCRCWRRQCSDHLARDVVALEQFGDLCGQPCHVRVRYAVYPMPERVPDRPAGFAVDDLVQ